MIVYQLNDKKSYIKRLQRMFGISETGIYDERLKEKISAYQKSGGLEQTGIVDYLTFKALIETDGKRRIAEKIKSDLPFLNNFPYTYGDIGEGVCFLNSLISDIIQRNGLDLRKPRGKFYNNDTVNAVKSLRKATNSAEAEDIDELLLNKLLKLK